MKKLNLHNTIAVPHQTIRTVLARRSAYPHPHLELTCKIGEFVALIEDALQMAEGYERESSSQLDEMIIYTRDWFAKEGFPMMVQLTEEMRDRKLSVRLFVRVRHTLDTEIKVLIFNLQKADQEKELTRLLQYLLQLPYYMKRDLQLEKWMLAEERNKEK